MTPGIFAVFVARDHDGSVPESEIGEFGWIMAGFEEKQTGRPFDLPVGKADCCDFHGSIQVMRHWVARHSMVVNHFSGHGSFSSR